MASSRSDALGEVGPAVGVEHGAVHGGVQLAELQDVGVALVGIVEAVVGLGQALVVADHERGAELVVGLAGGFEGGVGLPASREGEGLEAVGGGVAEVVLQRGRRRTAPRSRGGGTGGRQKAA